MTAEPLSPDDRGLMRIDHQTSMLERVVKALFTTSEEDGQNGASHAPSARPCSRSRAALDHRQPGQPPRRHPGNHGPVTAGAHTRHRRSPPPSAPPSGSPPP
jgi:hypothetical protein